MWSLSALNMCFVFLSVYSLGIREKGDSSLSPFCCTQRISPRRTLLYPACVSHLFSFPWCASPIESLLIFRQTSFCGVIEINHRTESSLQYYHRPRHLLRNIKTLMRFITATLPTFFSLRKSMISALFGELRRAMASARQTPREMIHSYVVMQLCWLSVQEEEFRGRG